MDEPEVQYLLQPSFECLGSSKPNIFMIVMTLSAPKNFEARNFVRNSIKKWSDATSREEGSLTIYPKLQDLKDYTTVLKTLTMFFSYSIPF